MRGRVGAVVALGAIAGLVGCGGAGDDVAPTPEEATKAEPEPARTTPGALKRPPLRAGQFSAQLKRSVWVRAWPGGKPVGTLKTRTKFGSRTALAVVSARPGWLGVLTELPPNGRIRWIPASAARLERQPYRIRIDLSRRDLSITRGSTQVRAFKVAVGKPGTETPRGRFGVTDTLKFAPGGPYGCCAIALTAHQTDVPSHWTGGTQVAIHATPDESVMGQAVSLGCVRTRQTDARWMLKNIPAGAMVTVVA
ncbi:MAG: L,D-transpeptidase family protein [Solirubrobacteraceae bacterium]|nr:L,D-transpeptidase family protein [Solirubrobacteraceae bacterium]